MSTTFTEAGQLQQVGRLARRCLGRGYQLEAVVRGSFEQSEVELAMIASYQP